MKEFEIAEKLDPGLPDTYHNMGNSYYEQKEIDKAIPLFEKAVQVDPNHWMSYQILANIYFDLGDYFKVAEYINKILPINSNPQLYTNLGVVYLKAGDKVKAKEAFQTALQMDPSNTFAAQAVNDIDNPALLGTESSNSAPDTSNPAMPGGQLPPEVLKQLQEQQQKAAASSIPTTSKSTPTPTAKK
jgi:tetratricopeptide (TPR) repeat protein